MIAASGSHVHPILVRADDPAEEVTGTVFTISRAELDAADAYDVSVYTRIEAPLRSGRRAWAYVRA